MARLTFDDRELPRSRRRIAPGHFQCGDHRSERIAQLVPEHGEEFVLAAIGVAQIAQEARVVERDRSLRGEAEQQALVVLGEVAGRRVREEQAGQHVSGSRHDRRREPGLDGSVGERRLCTDVGDAHRPLPAKGARDQLVPGLQRDRISPPCHGQQAVRSRAVEHRASLGSGEGGAFVGHQLRDAVGIELGGERDPQPAEDGIDASFLPQPLLEEAALFERSLQLGERIFGARSGQHLAAREQEHQQRNGGADDQRAQRGHEIALQRRQRDEGQRPVMPCRLDVHGFADGAAARL